MKPMRRALVALISVGSLSHAGLAAESSSQRSAPVLRLQRTESTGVRAIATPGAPIELRQGASPATRLGPSRAPTSSLVLKTADGQSITVDVYEAEAIDLETAIPARTTAPAVAASEPASTPVITAFALLPTQPNPFRGSILLRFQTPDAGHARLDLFDPAGRQVATAYDQACDPGVHTVSFAARELPAGLYFARLSFTSSATSVTRHASQRLVKVD